MAKQSSHPLSKVLASWLKVSSGANAELAGFKEYSGMGVEAKMDNIPIRIGSGAFMNSDKEAFITGDSGSHVHVMVNNVHLGRFNVSNQYREGIHSLVEQLQKKHYLLHVLSGDNDSEKNKLQQLFGSAVDIRFAQSPQNKLDYIQYLQKHDKKVLMLGDGLNDAGALMQSQVGIAVSDNAARFTPACDAIVDGGRLYLMDKFLAYARSGKKIITASFILSLLYNIAGLSFAVQGLLSPMVAAILMPISSISIILLVTLFSSAAARNKGL
jgi:Cu+-exporting ATPase